MYSCVPYMEKESRAVNNSSNAGNNINHSVVLTYGLVSVVRMLGVRLFAAPQIVCPVALALQVDSLPVSQWGGPLVSVLGLDSSNSYNSEVGTIIPIQLMRRLRCKVSENVTSNPLS